MYWQVHACPCVAICAIIIIISSLLEEASANVCGERERGLRGNINIWGPYLPVLDAT